MASGVDACVVWKGLSLRAPLLSVFIRTDAPQSFVVMEALFERGGRGAVQVPLHSNSQSQRSFVGESHQRSDCCIALMRLH